ncbi:MAG TPA: hypothetical protein VFV31_06130 [Chitinophagaceae bacterium]|nr:hypothetical protein [Chitinophagaceae bacterium]
MPMKLLLFLLLISVTSFAQPYAVGKRTIVFTDNSRSNRSISTDVFYPGTAAGTNVPVAGGSRQFPVVVFGHGFVMPASAYQWLADSLVPYGFIVAFPLTESGIAPSHEQLGRDMAFLCQRMMSLNDSTASFLYQRVLNRSAAAGHSMGGGASFLAMTYSSAITALFNFAAAESNPSAQTAAASVQRPSLLFSGSSDCITAPSVQQQLYNNIPYPCKSYINITGGLHCHFGNNDATCVLGQITSGCNSSSINAATVFQKTCSVLVPFLQYYLQGDCAAGQRFLAAYNNLTGVTKERVCSNDPYGCTVTGTTPPAAVVFRLYSSAAPAGTDLIISTDGKKISGYQLTDLAGRTLAVRSGLSAMLLTLPFPQRGVYFLRLLTGKQEAVYKVVRW